jgi:glycosyltransferase involved in cell wall biosynthesis
MVQTADVAVVIPTYNHARFLGRAIESVLKQSLRPSEVVVVDDGSTDAPDRVAARYPKVRLVAQRNAGLAAARNRGLRETSAAHILFLDADDWLHADALRSGLECLGQDAQAAFAYGAYRIVNEARGTARAVPLRTIAGDAFAAFLRGNVIGMHGTVLYRRAAVAEAGGFREELRACEDYDLYLRLAMEHPVLSHPTICADYRHHGANMSTDPGFMLRAALEVLRDYRPEAARRGLLADYREGVLGWKRTYVDVWGRLAKSRPRDALRPGAKLMRLAPAMTARKIVHGFVRRATRR